MIKYIFRDDWHKLNAVEIEEIFSNALKDIPYSKPKPDLILALQKQGVCNLQVLEIREQSVFYRLWQTDEIFISSNLPNYPTFVGRTENYLSFNHSDNPIVLLNKKTPVFAGNRLDGRSAIIQHLKQPVFFCNFIDGALVSISYPDEEPHEKLISKCVAFFKSYFSPLAD